MTTLARLARQHVSDQVGIASTATYDWHGVVGIRVIDRRLTDIGCVESQLGLEKKGLDRPPDLTIRFVDRLPLMGGLKYLASGAACAGDALVLTAGTDRRPLVRLPFASLGSSCEILVVRGVSPIPLLVPLLNLTALRKGYLPVQASAFVYRGMGVLVTGGRRADRTGTLLAFMSQGATFVGDGWVLLHPDGRAMYGLPTPMQVSATYLGALPEYRSRLDERTRRRLRMARSLLRLQRWLPNLLSENSISVRARARLADGLTVLVSPHRLFGAAARLGAGSPDIVLNARSVEAKGVGVKRIRTADLLHSLVPSSENEWRHFDRYYTLFRSAFPNRLNELIENRTKQLESGLQAALRDKRTYEFCCRSPVPIPEVVRVVGPLISSDGWSVELSPQGAVSE